jgi:hypothetical protein
MRHSHKLVMLVAVIGLAGGLAAPSLASARPADTDGTITVNTNVNDDSLAVWQGSTPFGGPSTSSGSIDLAPGSYQIYATGHSSASGWYSGPGTVDTASTQQAATPVVVTAGETTTIDWTLPPPADLHGKLLDSHGKPVYLACVTTIDTANGDTSYGAGTEHDGTWDIPNALPGTYDVDFVSCPGLTYTNAPWGYPVTFFDGKKGSLSEKKAVPVTIATNKAGVANSTVTAFGGMHGSVKLPSGANVRIEVYRLKAISPYGEVVLTSTPYAVGYTLPGKYQVAFYCQGGSICGDGVYVWYGGGGGDRSTAKTITVTPGTSLHVNEGAIPTIVAAITGHLRQGKVERAGVSCEFVLKSSCKGSVSLTTTLPPAHKHGKPRNHSVTKSFSAADHGGAPLSFPLPKAVLKQLAHHHGVKATLKLRVKGQATSTEHFTIH